MSITLSPLPLHHPAVARDAWLAERRALLAREKELGELKTRFVSMASHEFRTPLAAILSTTEILMLVWEQLDKAKIYDRLDRIRTQVRALAPSSRS